MSVQFKKYKHEKNENFDEFLQACGEFEHTGVFLWCFRLIAILLMPWVKWFQNIYPSGVGFMIRKMATSVSSTVQLVKTGDNSYSFNTSSTFRKTQLAFVLNEEFIEVRFWLFPNLRINSTKNFLGHNGWQKNSLRNHLRRQQDDSTAERWQRHQNRTRIQRRRVDRQMQHRECGGHKVV